MNEEQRKAWEAIVAAENSKAAQADIPVDVNPQLQEWINKLNAGILTRYKRKGTL